MKRPVVVLVLACSLMVAGAAGAHTADVHVKAGIACNMCHQSMPPQGAPDNSVCHSCHAPDALVARTAKMKPNNVHDNHLGVTECNECHGMHKDQPLPCADCHQFKFERPQR